MSLTICNECGNQVSASAESCPRCGAKGSALRGPKQKQQLGTKGKWIIGGAVASVAAVTMVTNQNAPPSLQQQAENKEEVKRTSNIVLYAKSLKAVARDPDSVVFERVLANRDGTITCFRYQTLNSLGGTDREWAAFTPAGGVNEGPAVRTICDDDVMKDVTRAAVPIIQSFE